MKVAIASDDGKVIASHFGRTLGFVIAVIENREVQIKEYRQNTFTGHARGLAGAGCGADRHGPILEALKDCQVVVSRGMGYRIYEDLKNAAIEVYLSDEIEVDAALNAYIQGKLTDRPERGCSHDDIHTAQKAQ